MTNLLTRAADALGGYAILLRHLAQHAPEAQPLAEDAERLAAEVKKVRETL